MLVVSLEMVKFLLSGVLVRSSAILWNCVDADGLESGGKGSAPSSDMSSAMCRKSPPMGELDWGEAIVTRPEVKMRPLIKELALEFLSLLLLCCPITCAATRPENRYSESRVIML